MPDPGTDAGADAEDGAARRYLTFRLAGRLYALPAEEVAEVIRLPAVARVPQGPKSLLGLANLRGAVLPVASLRGLLGQAAADAGEGARAIVLDGASPVALAVDGVESMVSVEPQRIETAQAALAADPGERLRAAFRAEASDTVAKVLDLKPLLEAAFVQPVRSRRAAPSLAGDGGGEAAEVADDTQKLVTFDVAGQEFALALDAVEEIVPAPAQLAVVPQAESVVLGVASHRDSLLPLLSLHALLGFAIPPAGEARKVVVTRVQGLRVGLVVDRMRAIVQPRPDEVEATPAMLAARTGGESRVSAIYRGEGGRRLISILAPEQLFREDVMQRLGDTRAVTDDATAAAEDAAAVKMLVFRLGEDEFALPIEVIDEVAQAPEQVTRVPKTPAFLDGVINLRGEVLPVVDQRRRFDMPPAAAGGARRLVVVRTERHRAGLLVDSVSEVLSAPAEAIEPAPDLTGEAHRLVQGVVNLEAAGRLVLLLDPAELLTRAERGLLDAFAAETAPAAS